MNKRFFLIGDIHGQYDKVKNLTGLISSEYLEGDLIIFLGDYIDRGPQSFEVIEHLILLSKCYDIVFLMGNHEDMFLRFYTTGSNYKHYLMNGGGATIKSYMKNCGDFTLPETHKIFFNNLKLFYESEDFIAVHAGLNPEVDDIKKQSAYDLLWIREEFYYSKKKWDKTIIFGHTPVSYLNSDSNIYVDNKINIIGIDTGAMVENFPLTCFIWPEKRVIQVQK